MSTEESLAKSCVGYAVTLTGQFSHLAVHSFVVKLSKNPVEPSAVYRWLHASGLFDQCPVTYRFTRRT